MITRRLRCLIEPCIVQGRLVFLPEGTERLLPACQRKEYGKRMEWFTQWALKELGLEDQAQFLLGGKPSPEAVRLLLWQVSAGMERYDRSHPWTMGRLLELCMDL